MTRSTISPDTIWLKKTEMVDDRLYLVLRVHSNIEQVTVEDADGKSHTEFEYDETESRYLVPDGVTSVLELQNFISAEAVNITQKAVREKAWKEIQAKPIEDLRKPVAFLLK